MIKHFKHKGLSRFFVKGDSSKIHTQHVAKLARILDRLDASLSPRDMNLPGYRLHSLSGKGKGMWSVRVSGNWRVTFKFEGHDVIQVDYHDYH